MASAVVSLSAPTTVLAHEQHAVLAFKDHDEVGCWGETNLPAAKSPPHLCLAAAQQPAASAQQWIFNRFARAFSGLCFWLRKQRTCLAIPSVTVAGCV